MTDQAQLQPTPSIEKALEAKLWSEKDKSFTDKLLSRQDVDRLRDLVKKEDLDRGDLLEILYLLSGVELKLANLDAYDRYVIGKYFTWVRDLVLTGEMVYDYEANLAKMPIPTGGEDTRKTITDTMQQIKVMLLHNIKFSVDVFLYITRSSLSVSAVGFDTLSKSRFEYDYTQPQIMPETKQGRSWLSLRG